MKFIIKPDHSWCLIGKDGPAARSVAPFTTVKAARADIVKAKRAMAGARFAKVEEES